MKRHKVAGLGKTLGVGLVFLAGACAQERFDVADKMRGAYGRLASDVDAGRAAAIYEHSLDDIGPYHTAVANAAIKGLAVVPDTTRVRAVNEAMAQLNPAYSFGICQNLR